MCGRYTLYANLNRILTDFAAATRLEYQYAPRYNIAPTQQVPIVRQREDDDGRELVDAKWWLIPPNSPEPATHLTTFNAKAETIATSFSYRRAFERRRCLVPLNGWYEFKTVGGTKSKPIKQPYLIHRTDRELFAFAGIWERWERNGLVVDSCSIVTAEPSDWFRTYHHREPVILDPENYDRWLDRDFYDRKQLEAFLVPSAEKNLEAYPVSKAVGNVSNQGPQLAARVETG